MFSLLIGIALLGVVFLLTLKRIKVDDDDQTITTGASQNNNKLTVFGEFKNAVKLFITRDMILLSFTFFYTGKLNLCFYQTFPPLIFLIFHDSNSKWHVNV